MDDTRPSYALTAGQQTIVTPWPAKAADAELHCGTQVWKLHKSVVCPQSKYFTVAFTGPFIEASTGILTIEELDEEEVGWIIDYFYQGTDGIKRHLDAQDDTTLDDLVHVAVVADYFQVDGLQGILMERAYERCTNIARPFCRIDTAVSSRLFNNQVVGLIRKLDEDYGHMPGIMGVFHKPLLSLVLACLPSPASTKALCHKIPDFFKGHTEFLINAATAKEIQSFWAEFGRECHDCRRDSRETGVPNLSLIVICSSWTRRHAVCEDCFQLRHYGEWRAELEMEYDALRQLQDRGDEEWAGARLTRSYAASIRRCWWAGSELD